MRKGNRKIRPSSRKQVPPNLRAQLCRKTLSRKAISVQDQEASLKTRRPSAGTKKDYPSDYGGACGEKKRTGGLLLE